jgi:deazaflavin-dependent oxidoreductase (nitroreductase family)
MAKVLDQVPLDPVRRPVGATSIQGMHGNTISPAKDALRTFNKHVLNPAMLLLAGRKHWYAAVIRHTGRRSGRTHATPVVAEQVADGFIIPLPYGTGVDWLRNALAAGKATITVGGRSFDVVDPRIIDAKTAAEQLPARRRRAFARFGIDDFVKFALATDSSEEHHGA